MCLGVPGRLTETFQEQGLSMGRVSFSGVARSVCLELLPEARVGDYVLVHVGFALTRIDEDEAARLNALLDQLPRVSDEAVELEGRP
jgi:hydrogenase expression/formation protein HypC